MRNRIGILLLAVVWLYNNTAFAQQEATNSFGKNWYVQLGLDMSLQNPYGCDFSKVFPNGKTFGIDAAVGKWFTPQFGTRVKLNWENGIGLFENHHANWLAPFYKPGENMDKGGYFGFYGDVMFNVHHLFSEYDEDRFWTTLIYPRAGAVYNCGAKDGSPLLGVGVENVFRLNEKWNVYFDVAYNMTSSAVTVAGNTDINSSSNGYFDINVGVQYDLGRASFKTPRTNDSDGKAVLINSFWSNWFVQAGLDMTLQNPYGCNFSDVFPNGKSFGLDAAVGKWFTPEIAIRGRVNWENGLFKNKDLTWLPPADNPEKNYEEGGYAVFNADVLFNLHNIICGYDSERKWQMSVYPRAGLIRQFGIGSGSPLVGAGIENTYRINDRLSLYADIDYQVTTSESSVSITHSNSSSNGFFDISLGVSIDLGESKGRFTKLQ